LPSGGLHAPPTSTVTNCLSANYEKCSTVSVNKFSARTKDRQPLPQQWNCHRQMQCSQVGLNVAQAFAINELRKTKRQSLLLTFSRSSEILSSTAAVRTPTPTRSAGELDRSRHNDASRSTLCRRPTATGTVACSAHPRTPLTDRRSFSASTPMHSIRCQ
jgi:hypothetical protein